MARRQVRRLQWIVFEAELGCVERFLYLKMCAVFAVPTKAAHTLGYTFGKRKGFAFWTLTKITLSGNKSITPIP